jgi:hypothetical protein
MVLGRFRDAMSDVAETLRRAFVNPSCERAEVGFQRPVLGGLPPLGALARTGDLGILPLPTDARLLPMGVSQPVPVTLQAALHHENAQETWGSIARTSPVPLFRADSCGRMAIPPLPRAPRPLRPDWGFAGRRGLAAACGLPAAAARALPTRFSPPRASSGLAVVLGMPVSIAGENIQALNKSLWMRYTVQFVKSSGENIRNVDILGLFRVPVKGVRELRHDVRNNRLLVQLDASAYGAKRQLFILARRKADGSLVSCFLEES